MNVVKFKEEVTKLKRLDEIEPGSIVRYRNENELRMVTDKFKEDAIMIVDIETGEYLFYEDSSIPVEVYDAEIILTKRR